MSPIPRRSLNAFERSHRGGAPILCADDERWIFHYFSSDLKEIVCGKCSIFGRVISRPIALVSAAYSEVIEVRRGSYRSK